VCYGLPSGAQDDLLEAVKWGIEENKLRGAFREKTAVRSQFLVSLFLLNHFLNKPSLLPVFDDMFTEAIQQLTQWGGVFVSETPE
jgi:hypothetical protein